MKCIIWLGVRRLQNSLFHYILSAYLYCLHTFIESCLFYLCTLNHDKLIVFLTYNQKCFERKNINIEKKLIKFFQRKLIELGIQIYKTNLLLTFRITKKKKHIKQFKYQNINKKCSK